MNKHCVLIIFKILTGIVCLSVFSCQSDKPVNNSVPAWYKDQLVYNLDVKTFKDSDGDGLGDFKGLTSKLDYLSGLGITTIWLAPFQPSPWEDDGYDITDYYAIDPRVGTKADFEAFMAAAKSHHIHVIMDIVLNHTSDQHPWFLSSKDSKSEKHNWYLWSAKRPGDWDEGMGFPEVEKETWRYNPAAKAYYFHRFYHFEPDLNFQNPTVLHEAEKIIGHWLNQGLDGFRFDAVPFVIDDPRNSSKHPDHDFGLLHQLVAFIKGKKTDAVILGEANVSPEENKDYLSKNNDGLDMMLNFQVNEYLFYALATGESGPLSDALNATGQKPAKDQWAYFLRNHDEVDLGKLSSHQLKEVFKQFGPDTNMQLYKRGIRRRLSPMLNADQQKLRLAYALLFGLPGTPIIRYGEEIGMGDNLALKERLAIRTPMQWCNCPNGGFSDGKSPFRPLISWGAYGYSQVNVADESRSNNSLLSFIKKMAALRRQLPIIGTGTWRVLNAGNKQAFALLYQDHNKRLLSCYNFQNTPVALTFQDIQLPSTMHEMISNKNESSISQGQKMAIKLSGYGFRWYQLN